MLADLWAHPSDGEEDVQVAVRSGLQTGERDLAQQRCLQQLH